MFSSDQQSQTTSGGVSMKIGDRLGTPRAVGIFFDRLDLNAFITRLTPVILLFFHYFPVSSFFVFVYSIICLCPSMPPSCTSVRCPSVYYQSMLFLLFFFVRRLSVRITLRLSVIHSVSARLFSLYCYCKTYFSGKG